jgi:hypothetical protein
MWLVNRAECKFSFISEYSCRESHSAKLTETLLESPSADNDPLRKMSTSDISSTDTSSESLADGLEKKHRMRQPAVERGFVTHHLVPPAVDSRAVMDLAADFESACLHSLAALKDDFTIGTDDFVLDASDEKASLFRRSELAADKFKALPVAGKAPTSSQLPLPGHSAKRLVAAAGAGAGFLNAQKQTLNDSCDQESTEVPFVRAFGTATPTFHANLVQQGSVQQDSFGFGSSAPLFGLDLRSECLVSGSPAAVFGTTAVSQSDPPEGASPFGRPLAAAAAAAAFDSSGFSGSQGGWSGFDVRAVKFGTAADSRPAPPSAASLFGSSTTATGFGSSSVSCPPSNILAFGISAPTFGTAAVSQSVPEGYSTISSSAAALERSPMYSPVSTCYAFATRRRFGAARDSSSAAVRQPVDRQIHHVELRNDETEQLVATPAAVPRPCVLPAEVVLGHVEVSTEEFAEPSAKPSAFSDAKFSIKLSSLRSARPVASPTCSVESSAVTLRGSGSPPMSTESAPRPLPPPLPAWLHLMRECHNVQPSPPKSNLECEEEDGVRAKSSALNEVSNLVCSGALSLPRSARLVKRAPRSGAFATRSVGSPADLTAAGPHVTYRGSGSPPMSTESATRPLPQPPPARLRRAALYTMEGASPSPPPPPPAMSKLEGEEDEMCVYSDALSLPLTARSVALAEDTMATMSAVELRGSLSKGQPMPPPLPPKRLAWPSSCRKGLMLNFLSGASRPPPPPPPQMCELECEEEYDFYDIAEFSCMSSKTRRSRGVTCDSSRREYGATPTGHLGICAFNPYSFLLVMCLLDDVCQSSRRGYLYNNKLKYSIFYN